MIDTASQRSATGLDMGARKLIFRVAAEAAGFEPGDVVEFFFRDRFGGLDDYLEGVQAVWGPATRVVLQGAIHEAGASAEFPMGLGRRSVDPREARLYALLLNAPEPDFRLAIETALKVAVGIQPAVAQRISVVCRNRGAPWELGENGFEYVGDEQVERDLVRPALAAINRPEFAGGVRSEFESARAELAKGTPEALKQAVHEAGCCLESAMKVVLDAHRVPYKAGDTAQSLFNHLEAAEVIPRHMEKLVLVAMTPRNRRGGHGAGAEAHAVSPSEAGAIVAGAGGAVAYLVSVLP